MTIVAATLKGSDTVLAKSESTIFLEGNYYFPPDDVKKGALTNSTTTYTCPWKGHASYHSFSADGKSVTDIAWSYPDPKPAATNIKGHVAFAKDKVDIRVT